MNIYFADRKAAVKRNHTTISVSEYIAWGLRAFFMAYIAIHTIAVVF